MFQQVQSLFQYDKLIARICLTKLQLTPLQTLISNAAVKRIMVLDDSKHVLLNNSYRSSLKSSIDKRHHPIQILSQDQKKEIINKIIVCRESIKEVVVDHFQHGKWLLGLNLDIATLEG